MQSVQLNDEDDDDCYSTRVKLTHDGCFAIKQRGQSNNNFQIDLFEP